MGLYADMIMLAYSPFYLNYLFAVLVINLCE